MLASRAVHEGTRIGSQQTCTRRKPWISSSRQTAPCTIVDLVVDRDGEQALFRTKPVAIVAVRETHLDNGCRGSLQDRRSGVASSSAGGTPLWTIVRRPRWPSNIAMLGLTSERAVHARWKPLAENRALAQHWQNAGTVLTAACVSVQCVAKRRPSTGLRSVTCFPVRSQFRKIPHLKTWCW
jgi:hypothetical protein